MPLSKPGRREAMHKRKIVCEGYLRADGLWDIEGHLEDTKGYDFENSERGTVHAGEPVHDMQLRLTVDNETRIHQVEAVTNHAPYGLCANVAPVFQQLVGLRIEPGWNRNVRRLVGGARGCTHLVELLGPLGTTALQTVRPSRNRHVKPTDTAEGSAFGARADGRPRLIDTCYALRSDSPVVAKLWPDHYDGE